MPFFLNYLPNIVFQDLTKVIIFSKNIFYNHLSDLWQNEMFYPLIAYSIVYYPIFLRPCSLETCLLC